MPTIIYYYIKKSICGCLGGKICEERSVCLIADEDVCVGGFVLVFFGALPIVFDKVEVYVGKVFEPSVIGRSGAIILSVLGG